MLKALVNKRLVFITVLFFVILGVQIYLRNLPAPEVKPAELKKLYTVPEFSLMNSMGDTVSLNRFKGKIWVADFIFTTCGGPCPVMTKNMAGVQKSFKENADVAFMSVTVHPSYDTPDVMATYAQEFEADVSTWEFLTGPFENIKNLAVQGFKLPADDNLASHSNRFVLIDRSGIIRGYYDGTLSADVEKLKRDLKSLL